MADKKKVKGLGKKDKPLVSGWWILPGTILGGLVWLILLIWLL